MGVMNDLIQKLAAERSSLLADCVEQLHRMQRCLRGLRKVNDEANLQVEEAVKQFCVLRRLLARPWSELPRRGR